MLIENLIEILKKCQSLESSQRSTRVQMVGFVVYSHPDQAITLYPCKPDWAVDEEERDIEITVLSETDDFAEITWREL